MVMWNDERVERAYRDAFEPEHASRRLMDGVLHRVDQPVELVPVLPSPSRRHVLKLAAAFGGLAVMGAAGRIAIEAFPGLSSYRFALAAYAEADVDGNAGVVSMNSLFPQGTSVAHPYDEALDAVDESCLLISRTYQADLSLIGHGIKSVEYRSNNPCVLFGSSDDGSEAMGPALSLPARDAMTPRMISLTYLVEGDDMRRLEECLDRVSHGEDQGDLEMLLFELDAEQFERTTLTVVVEFNDGAVRERSYGVRLVGDFRDRLAVLLDGNGGQARYGDIHTQGIFELIELTR